MGKSRYSRILTASLLVALVVGVVGGWALSRSSDDADVNSSPTTIGGFPTNDDNAGKPFPFVELTNLEGQAVTLSATENRPMVVNFWFSTCIPCKREMPVLAEAASEYESRIDFVGINPNDTSSAARDFLDKYGVTYPNYLDDGDQTAAAGVATMPATFFLSADGTIIARKAGEVTATELSEYLTTLISEGT